MMMTLNLRHFLVKLNEIKPRGERNLSCFWLIIACLGSHCVDKSEFDFEFKTEFQVETVCCPTS